MGQRKYYSREAEQRANRERAIIIMLFLGIGLSIGAVMALLFAPKSGAEIRGEINKAFESGVLSGRDTTNSVVERLEQEFAELRKRVDDRR